MNTVLVANIHNFGEAVKQLSSVVTASDISESCKIYGEPLRCHIHNMIQFIGVAFDARNWDKTSTLTFFLHFYDRCRDIFQQLRGRNVRLKGFDSRGRHRFDVFRSDTELLQRFCCFDLRSRRTGCNGTHRYHTVTLPIIQLESINKNASIWIETNFSEWIGIELNTSFDTHGNVCKVFLLLIKWC